MANIIDNLKWKQFLLKEHKLMLTGAYRGKVCMYDEELINNLNNVYYGGIPASVIILTDELCNGYCYDRAVLLATGFNKDDNFRIVRGAVDAIALNPSYKDRKKDDPLYSDHCVVEKTDADGKIWIYDPSLCIKFEKKLYYKLENFKERHISSKEDTINYCEYQDIINTDINMAKESAPLLIPIIEPIVLHSKSIYREKAIELLNQYKEKIGYEDMIAEQKYFKNVKGLRKKYE